MKYALLSRAHIMINPSIREGWGLVVLEGASVGTPTIAFNVPGLCDSIINGKTGLICSSEDIDAFATLALNLFSNQKKYKQMQYEGKQWARRFTWKNATKESLRYIEEAGAS